MAQVAQAAQQAGGGQVPEYLAQMLRAKGVQQNQIQAPPPPPKPPAVPYGNAPSLNDPMSQPANQHPLGIDGEGLETAPGASVDGDAGTPDDPLLQSDGTEETSGLLPDGTVDRERIANTMAQQLAMKLEENPSQVSNPQLYDISGNPQVKAQMDMMVSKMNLGYGGDAGNPALADADPMPGSMPVSAGGVPQQLNLDPNAIPSVGDVLTQAGDVPGMLSTLQTGSRMRTWGHGSSRKI